MKPSELQPLVGRLVDVYHDGERVGKVKGVVRADVLAVRFTGDRRSRHVWLGKVRGVWWRKRLETVEQFLERSSGGAA